MHNNSNLSEVPSGTSTYFALENQNFPEGGALAAAVHASLVNGLGSADFGIRTADFHVIKYCELPGILLEVLFLSNPADEARLAQAETAELTGAAVAAGVEQYFSGASNPAPAVTASEDESGDDPEDTEEADEIEEGQAGEAGASQ